MWFVYILFCDQKMFYVGMTQNMEKRLLEHKSGKSQFTKQFSEMELVYSEEYQSKNEAEQRERQLKGWGKAKKKALITGDKKELVNLSRSIEFVEV